MVELIRHARCVTLGLLVMTGYTCQGCFGGVASARYRGKVSSGTRSSYSFDEERQGQRNLPIENANVALFAGELKDTCSSRPGYGGKPKGVARTDDDGRFEVNIYYTGPLGQSTKLVLCVAHPDYEPFQYETMVGVSTEPRGGEKPLSIILVPKK